jgi:glucuronate isomerase
MSKKDVFITKNFVLETPLAAELYHTYAAPMPIIDYHCHLPPNEIADDRRYANLTQIWLAGDHYKWRAMRTNGVDERYCTGHASDWEKFQKWAETVPQTLRNPLYHWTHMELKKPFGISDRLLNPSTAKGIWDECNQKLALPEFSVRGLLRQANVVVVCTTDDPIDDLRYHRKLAADKSFPIQILPAYRPDKGLAIEVTEKFNAWVDKLGEAANVTVNDYASYLQALRKRGDYFHANGCRLSDHGLEQAYAEEYTDKEVAGIFAKARSGKPISRDEALKFKSAVLVELGRLYHEKGWTQQFHLGALRNNNTRLLSKLGPDTGFDSIGDFDQGRALSKYLDRLDSEDKLARTILYNLNPRDNDLFATMIGNFQDGSVPGKIQFGSGWWFLDQKDGMEKQMNSLSNMGLLSRFVGMLTDSRSFLSYSRHEYFRRILCDLLANDVKLGLIPRDVKLLGQMVQNICYHNAARYF